MRHVAAVRGQLRPVGGQFDARGSAGGDEAVRHRLPAARAHGLVALALLAIALAGCATAPQLPATVEVPVAVGYQMLHNPLLQKAADMIEGGVLGTVKSFRASCRLSQVFSPKKGWTFTRERAGGGVMINSGVHVLSMLARLFGRPCHHLHEGQLT